MRTIFVDRCLEGKKIISALRDMGFTVVGLSQHYGIEAGSSVPDTEWMEMCGERGWVALTKDSRIMRDSEEFDALVRAKLVYISIANSNLTVAEVISLLKKHQNRLKSCLSQKGPRLYVITNTKFENRTKVIGTAKDPRIRDQEI